MKIRNLLVVTLAVALVVGPVYAHKEKNKGKGKGNHLPRGLQKKLQRGAPLPPGWQKKLSKGHILDDSIYAQGRIVLPIGKDGTISIEVEGTLIKLHEKTRKIIHILTKT